MRHGFIRTMAAILGISAAAALDFDPGGFSVHIAPGGLGARTTEETNITVRAFPVAFLDNQFALSQGQPGVLRLAFNNAPEVKIGKLTAFLELPKAIQLVGLGRNLSLLSQEPAGDMVRLAIDAGSTRGTITAKGYNIFGALPVMLKTDAAPGSKWQGAYWLEHDGYVSPRLPLTFTVIPTIRSVQPKRFETGVHFTDNCINFKGAPLESYAQFYAETGCNAAMIVPGAMSQKLRSMGIIRYYQPSGWLVNGYMIGKPPGLTTSNFSTRTALWPATASVRLSSTEKKSPISAPTWRRRCARFWWKTVRPTISCATGSRSCSISRAASAPAARRTLRRLPS